MAAALICSPPPKVPTVFPLSKDQQGIFDLYTSNSFFQRLNRDYLFLSNTGEFKAQLWDKTLTGLGIGGFIGGLSTFVALKCLGRKEESTKDDNKLTLKISGFGAGLGATVGALFAATYNISKMEEAKEYLAWRDSAIKSHVFPLFQKFLEETDQLRDFLCDLTQELIRHPVRAPNGKVYEKTAIEDWLTHKAIEFLPERLAAMSPDKREEALTSFCPGRSCHLTSDMLVYDFEYHRKVAIAMKPLFDQQIDQQFAQGLLNYRIAMFKDRETLMNEIVREITAKFTSGSISENDFVMACRNCRAHYALPQ